MYYLSSFLLAWKGFTRTMFLKKITVSFCVLGMCLSTLHVSGQFAGTSPYSQLGVGDLTPEGFSRNEQMGNGGVATFSPNFVNNLNPATLSSLAYTNFDFGLNAGYKNMKTSTEQATDGGGNFGHLAISVPISPKWGASVGIKPYSNVNYSVAGNSVIPKAGTTGIDTNTYVYQYEGKGNLVEFYLSNGVKLNKNFSVGLTAGYVFGALKYNQHNNLSNLSTAASTTQNRETYSQVTLKPGIFFRKQISYIDVIYRTVPSQRRTDSTGKLVDSVLYKQKLSLNDKKGSSKNMFFNIAATSDFMSDLSTSNFTTLSYENTAGQAIKVDTLVSQGNYKRPLPFSYRIGTSLDRPNAWTIAFDISQRFWGNYSDQAQTRTQNMVNSFSANLGGEYFSSIAFGNRSKNILILRGGLYYQQGPLNFNNTVINDQGLSLGCSFQLPKIKNEGVQYPKYINLGVSVGQRGTTQNNLIAERYIRINLSVTVNDRWFIRPKHD